MIEWRIAVACAGAGFAFLTLAYVYRRRALKPKARRMIEVYKIPLLKEKLRAMPDDERALFFLLGYASNQLSFFSKLVIFSTNQDGRGDLEPTLSGAQTQMALRQVIGVLSEAWRLIHARFMGAPYAQEYTPLLDAGGAEAFRRLKQEFDAKDGLLSKLRNSWIFHHPNKTAATGRCPLVLGVQRYGNAAPAPMRPAPFSSRGECG